MLFRQDAGVKAGRQQLLSALDDKSAMVRITAAEALGRFGTDEDAAKALDVLIEQVQPDADTWAGISAWNAIDYMDERARPKADVLLKIGTDVKAGGAPGRVQGYAKNLKPRVLADLGLKEEKPKKNQK